MTTEKDQDSRGNEVMAETHGLAAQTHTQRVPESVPMNQLLSVGEKPEKFTGPNFKRWQQKMLFYLTTMNLAKLVTDDEQVLKEDEKDTNVINAVKAWKKDDFLCRNYIMNSLENNLYEVYLTKNTAKELWESLDRKYKTEDAGTKKFVVGRFLDFKMVDSKTVISQVQEFQVILHYILRE
ncbi:uncharacterized protein LOC133034567 [Cannabis sativa]|uniref:uncharacterized protein LOC133034567 n=1 Tax=Cannabis sativa TaxID=3483 RepID=UPI0029C9FC2D|nr:uncharacterized protein LOC133034567 [Cannabis sativa]